MNCPSCRALIDADDVNLDNLLAKCRKCQEVFRFAPSEVDAVTAKARDFDPPAPARRGKAPRPGSLVVDDSGIARRIVKRWFNSGVIGGLLFCVLWDGFLVVWYTIAFTEDGPWMMIVFPLLHVAAGVILTYSVIAGFMNRTIVTLRDETLEIWHGPMPWPGNLRVPSHAIRQLYCTPAPQRRNNYGVLHVNLNAAMKDGRTVKLLASMNRDEGLFLEQQLEDWLRIKPEHVPGQVD